jgi:hypothetical protein
MIKIDGKIIKAKSVEWVHYRYRLNLDMFEILTNTDRGWCWVDDPRYYTTVMKTKEQGGTFIGKPIKHLLNVTWFDPHINTKQVRGGHVYRIYLLHGLEKQTDSMDDVGHIFVRLYAPFIKEYEEKYKAPFISERVKESLEIGSICKTFVYDLDLTGYPPQSNIEVNVHCFSENRWKS